MGTVYYKPLTRGRAATQPPLPTDKKVKVLHRLGQLALEEIRREVDRSDLNSKRDIKGSLQYLVKPNSVTVKSDHPTFTFLEEGVRPHAMRYAKNKVVAINLNDLHHKTLEDVARGVGFRRTGDDPQHPGVPPMRLVKRGLDRARQRLIEELAGLM